MISVVMMDRSMFLRNFGKEKGREQENRKYEVQEPKLTKIKHIRNPLTCYRSCSRMKDF